MKTPAKGIPWFLKMLVTGVILVLVALIYNALFPKAFWLSHELEQNRTKWENRNITHYQMSIAIFGYGPYNEHMPLRVEVSAGKIISIFDSLGNSLSPANNPGISYLYPDTLTIPGLFSFAHKTMCEKLPSIRVSYNFDIGYPEEISVVPYPEPCCQGFTINVRDFQILSP
jgi:hypothetical protein